MINDTIQSNYTDKKNIPYVETHNNDSIQWSQQLVKKAYILSLFDADSSGTISPEESAAYEECLKTGFANIKNAQGVIIRYVEQLHDDESEFMVYDFAPNGKRLYSYTHYTDTQDFDYTEHLYDEKGKGIGIVVHKRNQKPTQGVQAYYENGKLVKTVQKFIICDENNVPIAVKIYTVDIEYNPDGSYKGEKTSFKEEPYNESDAGNDGKKLDVSM